MKKLTLLFLSTLFLTACSLHSTKVVYDIEPIDSTYSKYKCYKYQWVEGAERVSITTVKDTSGKYAKGDTIK